MISSRLGGGPVEAVIFDYGFTLVTYERPTAALQRAYAQIARLLSERLAIPVPEGAVLLREVHDAVDARIAEHEASAALEEIDASAAHAAAYAALGLQLPADLIDAVQRIEQEAWWSGIRLVPGAVTTLEALRARGLRLGLCSNAPYRAESMHAQLDHLGLTPLLDAAVFSSGVGWRKPSPRLFKAALLALHAPPATTVVVGDRVREDVEGGHAAGMRAVLLQEHHEEPDPEHVADAVIGRLTDLVALLSPRV